MGSGTSTPRAVVNESKEITPKDPKRIVLPTLVGLEGVQDVIRKVSSASVSLVTSQKATARVTARENTPFPTPRELRSELYKDNKDKSKKKWSIGNLFVVEYLDPDEPQIDSALLGVKRKENMSPYDAHHEITSMLGCGSFSTIYKCTPRNQRIPNGTYVAIKEIDTRPLSLPQIRSIRYEMNILSQLQKHENIITFYCVYVKRLTLYMILEHCAGGELLDTICTLERYTEDHVRQIMFQLVDAVRYMHHRKIIHRDIHPEIILVKNDIVSDRIIVKIVDMGYAMGISSTSSEPTFSIFGTPGFIAPEVMIDTLYHPACDIWSLGVMFYVLLSGLMPFSKTNPGKLFSGHFSFPSSHFSTVSQAAKDLISDMLEVKSIDRPSATKILTHAWLESEVVNVRKRQLIANKLAKEKAKELAAKRNARISAAAVAANKKTSKDQSFTVDQMDAMTASIGIPHSTSLQDISQTVETNVDKNKVKSPPSSSSSSPASSSSSSTSSSLQQQQQQQQQQQRPQSRRLIDSIALPGSGSASYDNLVAAGSRRILKLRHTTSINMSNNTKYIFSAPHTITIIHALTDSTPLHHCYDHTARGITCCI